MLALPPIADSANAADSYASERFRPPPAIERAISSVEPSHASLQNITLQQKFLGLGPGRIALRFLHPQELQQDLGRQLVMVVGWDLTVPNSKDGLASVTREMARKFLRLWQDAEHQRLSAEDKKAWFHIVHHVDMDAFYRSLERPRYLEAQLGGSPAQWYLRWPGEEGSTKVPREFCSHFSLYERGEWIGAHFLLDEHEKVIAVENVVPALAPDYDGLDDWPPVAS